MNGRSSDDMQGSSEIPPKHAFLKLWGHCAVFFLGRMMEDGHKRVVIVQSSNDAL